MNLSDRERRMLAEIEQGLRGRDRLFACRIDALNAACARRRTQRFACHTGRRELTCVLLLVIAMTALSMLVVLLAGHARPAPAPYPPPGTALEELGRAPAG
ncbi:DUF3040 domain-containing protein [Nonomuraea sp. NPDC050783]|uniref:DUF3040 domain-containing protein n=1 Tax=Nonomuraea sp. NPDC050783 TaxID=3154634 RepID=UPI0034650413